MIVLFNTTAKDQTISATEIEALFVVNGVEIDHSSLAVYPSHRPLFVASLKCIKFDGTLVTLGDFNSRHSFGNGVTCNAGTVLRDGHRYWLSWACLTPQKIDGAKFRMLLDFIENGFGGYTG